MSGPRTAFHRHHRAALGLLAAAAALALPAAAHATVAGEQVDRGDGSSGATNWGLVLPPTYRFPPEPQPLLISDDGRYAVLSYPSSPTTTGLYRRDVQLNTLRLIVDGVTATGATGNRTKLSVVTSRSLAAADTNATGDLYLVDPFSGAATLASVGAGGAAVGGVSRGAVTSDGTAVLYSTAAGTTRRELATGATTITPGLGLSATGASPNISDDQITPDGRTFLGAGRIVHTPTDDISVVETSSTLSQGTVRIAADGSVAVASLGLRNPWGTSADAGKVRVYSLADGTRTTVQPQLPAGWGGPTVLAVSADGRSATVGSWTVSGNVTTYALGKLDLTTGAITKTSDDMPARFPTVLSRNGRYGLAPDLHHLFAVPAVVGATLPGGVDGASPLYYLGYEAGCAHPQFYTPDNGRPHLSLGRLTPATRGWGLPISSVSVSAYVAANNTLMNSAFLAKNLETTAIQGYYGAVRVDASATFQNGTTAFDRGTVPAYQPEDCYVLQF